MNPARGRIEVRPGPRTASTPPADPVAEADERESDGLTQIVGDNLRRARKLKGLSLAGLSAASGVSRAMLSQVELGRSTPTVNLLWRIARALGVPFSALLTDTRSRRPLLLRAADARTLNTPDSGVSLRPLFPPSAGSGAELYEVWLGPGATERPEPKPSGVVATLVASRGSVRVTVDGEPFYLAEGDALWFAADAAHELWNPGDTRAQLFFLLGRERAEPQQPERPLRQPPPQPRSQGRPASVPTARRAGPLRPR